MVALFSTSLLHANITYEANAAVVQQQSVCKGTVVDNNGDPVVGASVFVVSNGINFSFDIFNVSHLYKKLFRKFSK